MRGTQSHQKLRGRQDGIIPAYAGNTETVARRTERQWDHPRVCGEHFLSLSYSVSRAGSSPRMRGTRHHGIRRYTRPGIIPAYAGNTHGCTRQAHPARDHPRVCGEHDGVEVAGRLGQGSSPRMRGTHEPRITPRDVHGIIPAYAGNTSGRLGHCPRRGDHPRVCGEHYNNNVSTANQQGSSPRMRGTRYDFLVQFRTIGIIPAYAGNTNVHSS